MEFRLDLGLGVVGVLLRGARRAGSGWKFGGFMFKSRFFPGFSRVKSLTGQLGEGLVEWLLGVPGNGNNPGLNRPGKWEYSWFKLPRKWEYPQFKLSQELGIISF